MAKIFTADTDFYLVADTIDDAVTKYYEDKSIYPTTITLFKDSSFVITESNVVAIVPLVLPALALADGASISPATSVFIKEGDQITLTATPSANYTTFVNWTVDGVEVSTANPFTYTALSTGVTLNANFTA